MQCLALPPWPLSSLVSVRQLVWLRLRLAIDRAAVTAAYRQPCSCLRTTSRVWDHPSAASQAGTGTAGGVMDYNRGRVATTLPSSTYKTHTHTAHPQPLPWGSSDQRRLGWVSVCHHCKCVCVCVCVCVCLCNCAYTVCAYMWALNTVWIYIILQCSPPKKCLLMLLLLLKLLVCMVSNLNKTLNQNIQHTGIY